MTRLSHVKPGQSFKPNAPAHNAFVDAAQYVEALKARGGTTPGRDNWQSSIIQVKNTTESDLARFSILGIDPDNVFPTPTDNLGGFQAGPLLYGETPEEETHFGSFVVLLEPAPADGIVAACVSGMCVCKVNITDENATRADVKDDDEVCLDGTGVGAAQILWRESGTGVVWAVVRIGNIDGMKVAFTMTEDMGATTSGEASVTLHGAWDPSTEAYTGSGTGVVISPGTAFDAALDGAYGEGTLRRGDGRMVIDPNWISC